MILLRDVIPQFYLRISLSRWKEPLDDGGSPITGYVLEKMDTATGRWTQCAKTDGALEADVKGLETGKRYRYGKLQRYQYSYAYDLFRR